MKFNRCNTLLAAATLIVAATASAQTTLTPAPQRISDAAIQADHQTYEAMQARIKALNDRGRPARDHHLAKAQCWLDVSFHEYSRNDRSAFPQEALGESEKLIVAMERGTSPLPMDTPLVNGAARLRPDLWARSATLRGHEGWRCAQAKAACGEVELVHAGNEHNQQQWRHAKPYVQLAEDLIGEAEGLAASCVPPLAARRAAARPVAPVVAPTPPPQPAVAAGVPVPYSLKAQVVFNFDRFGAADIRPASLQQLEAALATLRNERVVLQSVRLVGHADRLNSTGKADYNQRLSEKRAATVRGLLEARGIEARLIQTDARGDTQPVEPCSQTKGKGAAAAECLLPNRRVEVQFVGGRP